MTEQKQKNLKMRKNKQQSKTQEFEDEGKKTNNKAKTDEFEDEGEKKKMEQKQKKYQRNPFPYLVKVHLALSNTLCNRAPGCELLDTHVLSETPHSSKDYLGKMNYKLLS